MDNIWIMLAIGLAAVIAGALIYAATRPNQFSTSRSTTIAAAPEAVFPLIDSPVAMNRWNPFIAPDPAIQLEYYGPQSGVGAGNKWRGNREVGAGTIEITESNPVSRVVLKLHMVKPMQALNRVEFTLRPSAGGGTDVSWTMSGRQPFIGKLMSLVIDCDKMVGRRFEEGLASLKALAEKTPIAAARRQAS